MNDPRLNELLRWGVQNSEASRAAAAAADGAEAPTDAKSSLTPDMLAALMGGPSDADLMRESMTAITSDQTDLENKLVAFDNFEQLVEQIDNANNMDSLGLWAPLLKQLEHDEAELRRMAAWCVSTTVQNNIKAQEALLSKNAIPTLVNLAINDPSQAVRKKAISALSSSIRNFQPGLDEAVKSLPEEHQVVGNLDAGDMESVDVIIQKLRDDSQRKG